MTQNEETEIRKFALQIAERLHNPYGANYVNTTDSTNRVLKEAHKISKWITEGETNSTQITNIQQKSNQKQ